MSVSSINGSVQNQYPQISTSFANKTTAADAVTTPPKMVDSLDQIGKDIVQLSPQAIAMLDASNAASSVTETGNNPTRALTLEDMVLIGYPDPNDPNVAILAEGISQARETGQLKGPITDAFLKGGNAQYKSGLFDMLPSDPASLKSSAKTKKAVLDRLHGVQDSKEVDLNKLLRKAGFLQTAGTDSAQATQLPQTQTLKAKAMLRDYSA
jgi:hypothetical protein